MLMKKLIVSKKYNNKKLDTFLKDNIDNLSNNLFYKTLFHNHTIKSLRF